MAKKILLEYRYEREDPWRVYDWTTVNRWADTQEQRMKTDYPGAMYRRRTEGAKVSVR